MFHPLPTPFLPSGVNLTKLAPGLVWFFFLKTHSLQNRQKTGIKGYPSQGFGFQEWRQTSVLGQIASDQKPSWLPSGPQNNAQWGRSQVIKLFPPSSLQLWHQGCSTSTARAWKCPAEVFLFLPKVLQPFRFFRAIL